MISTLSIPGVNAWARKKPFQQPARASVHGW